MLFNLSFVVRRICNHESVKKTN